MEQPKIDTLGIMYSKTVHSYIMNTTEWQISKKLTQTSESILIERESIPWRRGIEMFINPIEM